MSEPQETFVSKTPLFPLGHVVATPRALAALRPSRPPASSPTATSRGTSVGTGARSLRRTGGRTSSRSSEASESSLPTRTRLGVRLWVITEADRSSTCVLLPEEY